MTSPNSPQPPDGPADQAPPLLVVGPDGRPMAVVPQAAGGGAPGAEPGDVGDPAPGDLVEHPAKVLRIGTMAKQLLDEVRAAPLDDASRVRLREIYQGSITELCSGLAPDLCAELHRLSLPFSDDAVPSDAELRIAQAQLVGGLEGLFHGIQTALVAQQMAARMQLEEMRRRALPGGPGQPAPGNPTEEPSAFGRPGGSGPYL